MDDCAGCFSVEGVGDADVVVVFGAVPEGDVVVVFDGVVGGGGNGVLATADVYGFEVC